MQLRRGQDPDAIGPCLEAGGERFDGFYAWHLCLQALQLLRIRIAGPQICKSQLCQQAGMSIADAPATGNQDTEILAGLMQQLKLLKYLQE